MQTEPSATDKPIEFLQSVLDGIADPVMVIGTDYRVLSVNRAALARAPALTGDMRCHQVSHHCDEPCDGREHVCPLRRVMATNAPVTVIHKHTDSDGGDSLVEVTATPLRNSLGTIIGIVETAHDITALKKTEIELQTILATANDGFVLANMQGRILGCNDAFCAMIGYSRSELLNLFIADLDVQDSQEIRQRLQEIRQHGHARFESAHRRCDGSIIDVEVSVSYVDFDGGKLVSFVRDISTRKQAEEQIRQLAYYDPLTSLPNRRLLADRINHALVQAKRFGRSTAVMFIDLDHFKEVNDSLGHRYGDELLKRVAERLGNCVREGDTVARAGGDEFVIVLTEVAHPHDATRVARKIVEVMQAPFVLEGQAFEVTASIGIAVHPHHIEDDNGEELMRKADKAMYEAKNDGRNGYRIFDDLSWQGAAA